MWDSRLDDRLRLGKEVGVGAFARVYQGVMDRTGQQVAIKVLRSSRRDDPLMHRMMEREVQILEQLLEGPKLVRLLATGTLSARRTVVMELCEYGTVWEALVRSGLITPLHHYVGLPPTSVKAMTRDMVDALRYVHARHIVHADLKPENIFVRRGPDGFEYVLGDFGSATVYKRTRIHDYVQSRYYRAPEINLGRRQESNVTMAIDVWSLGCIVFELLVGRPLFRAKDRVELARKHVACLGVPDKDMLRAATNAGLYVRHAHASETQPIAQQWSSLRTAAAAAAATDWGTGADTTLEALPASQVEVLRQHLPEAAVYARWISENPQHGQAMCARLQQPELHIEAHAFVQACVQYKRPAVTALNLSYLE